MNTGFKNPIVVDEEPSFTKNSMCSQPVTVSVKNKRRFPPLNDAISFRTLDYDAQIHTKVGFPIIHVNISTTIEELKTLRHLYELERA